MGPNDTGQQLGIYFAIFGVSFQTFIKLPSWTLSVAWTLPQTRKLYHTVLLLGPLTVLRMRLKKENKSSLQGLHHITIKVLDQASWERPRDEAMPRIVLKKKKQTQDVAKVSQQ